MSNFTKKEVLQAILIADNNLEHFLPISNNISTGLLPLCNVAALDYSLEALNRCGVEEVFIYSSAFVKQVENHISCGIAEKRTWSFRMKVTVFACDGGTRCLGNALRDMDTKGNIRGHFILLNACSVTNADLASIIEEHKKVAKFDRGAASTVIYKEVPANCRTGDGVFIAIDEDTKRLHFHQRLKTEKESEFKLPLEIFLQNSKITLHHNLIDPQIAICSPSVLSLFSDNFDFETRDEFIRGLVINEEILDSRIYVHLLPPEQYARNISNWLTYRIINNDIMNRWTYPLVPDMGVCYLRKIYRLLRNNNYISSSEMVSFSSLKGNVVIDKETSVGAGSEIFCTVIGKNCKIGKDCTLKNSYIMGNVTIEDNCYLDHCVISYNVKVGKNCKITNGVIIGSDVGLESGVDVKDCYIENKSSQNLDKNVISKELGKKAYVIENVNSKSRYAASEDETNLLDGLEDEGEDLSLPPKITALPSYFEDSDYDSVSEKDESRESTPLLDDAAVFLTEVIDSLNRGFNEKSNPDFLILEINSSRYAYNMSLKEVNFYVGKAIFSLDHIKNEERDVLGAVNEVFNRLGAVVSNYIKTQDSMVDFLKAFEECCLQEPLLVARAVKILFELYNKEFVSEEAILLWYSGLDEDAEPLNQNLTKLIEWLEQSSEEEDSDEE